MASRHNVAIGMRVLDLLLPPACAGCGRSGEVLCRACVAELRPPMDPRDRFIAADGGVVIGERLILAVAAFAYEGPMRHALADLKYRGRSRVAPVLAELCLQTLRRLAGVSGPAVLVPVPIHAGRRNARGYNQAALLASELGRISRLPVRDVLERTRPTTKQHRLNRTARLANLRGAFAAASAAPRTAVLVDDIITTAATLEACASVLAAAGSAAVFGLAVAREV